MDLLAKVERFEKMALELLETGIDVQEAETIEEYTAEYLQQRAASTERLNKLSKLAK